MPGRNYIYYLYISIYCINKYICCISYLYCQEDYFFVNSMESETVFQQFSRFRSRSRIQKKRLRSAEVRRTEALLGCFLREALLLFAAPAADYSAAWMEARMTLPPSLAFSSSTGPTETSRM